jgi:phosphate transport system permease protein
VVILGGVGVILAVVLIFFYLLWVVLPLFAPARLEPIAAYGRPGAPGATVHLAIEEQAEVAVRFTAGGTVTFFDARTGTPIADEALVPADRVTSFAEVDGTTGLVAVGLADGRALVVQHAYEASFAGDGRRIVPRVRRPLGAEPLVVSPEGRSLRALAVQQDAQGITLVGATSPTTLDVARYARRVSFLDESAVTLERRALARLELPAPAAHLLLSSNGRWLYAAQADGHLGFYDLTQPGRPALVERVRVVDAGREVSVLRPLVGGVSVLVGDSGGRVTQWFPVRDAEGRFRLERVRSFDGPGGPIADVAAEHRRKGFLAADRIGSVGVYHTTAERTLARGRVADPPLLRLAVAPRGDALLTEDAGGTLRFWRVRNPHPEVSWSALWGAVWYENYAEPDYVWQSSAATSDFEPKFSIVPLAFGTIKAAFYAMLLAAPLGIAGAIYTGYFMAPRMRSTVKPVIELMGALPTVILGFLAGLWLAPFVERSLPGLLLLLLAVPLAVVTAAWCWTWVPPRLRGRVPEGWEGILLVPVVVAAGWLALGLGGALETSLLGGDMRRWLANTLGIDYDQRNALIVAIAMGFAVVPVVFSMTEDAIFSVPRQLTQGSLALGATSWQTLVGVVLPTASPALFSALMIGFGRAVGETMIVLMATGNTPIMDMSLFEGMRTLSANIAVEMAESELGSSHYRVLFLTGLVLFCFTFVLNTGAEIVRQRLRRRYGSL